MKFFHTQAGLRIKIVDTVSAISLPVHLWLSIYSIDFL
jgi:hypothetical protein